MLRVIKVLHTAGAPGLMGGLAAYVILIRVGAGQGPLGALAVRRCIDGLLTYLLLPSMVVVVVSGFLSMIVHRPYRDALWAGVKGVSGMGVLELTLHLQSQARDARELMEQALGGHPDAEALGELLHFEWVCVWLLVVLAVGNVALAVWRPRFGFIRGMPGAAEPTR
jgi:hypothetical protein